MNNYHHMNRKNMLKHILKNAGAYDPSTLEDAAAELEWMEEYERMVPKPVKQEGQTEGPKEKKS